MTNHKNIAKHLVLLSSLCGLILNTGCGKTESVALPEDGGYTSAYMSEEPAQEEQEIDPATDVHPIISSSQESAEPLQTTSASSSIEESSHESSDSPAAEDTEEEPLIGTKLTPEELQAYTELLQSRSNYGFLLSDWSNPTEINLYQVFYTGAGISREGTEAEKQAFLERNEQDALYTDFRAMDKTAVNDFLLEKVGITYDELVMKGGRGMEESYYAESDSFCMETGDTNYVMFECTDGVINEDGYIVTLRYECSYGWIQKGEVQMWKDGSSFRSNHILKGEVLDMME